MIPPAYSYAILLGTDVALGSLRNIEAWLGSVNRVASGEPTAAVAIVSEPPDLAPIRNLALDGREYRDGMAFHVWNMTLTTGGVSAWLNYLFSAAVAAETGDISIAVTINTRQHQFSSYARLNALAIYPTLPTQDNNDPDLTYLHRRGVWQLRQRFHDLTTAS